MRALPVALTLMDQARGWKGDTDLCHRLADQAFGLLVRDAVPTIIGLQNAGELPDCGTPAREQVIDLAGAGDAGIGTVILICDREYVREDRGARQVREDPAAPVNLASEMRYGAHGAGDWPMALTITNHLVRSADAPHTAGLGDGGEAVTWLPGRVLTEGLAAAMATAGAASQIPADCNPEVHDERSWSPRGRLGRPVRLYWTRRQCTGIRGARGRVMARPAAGCGVVAAVGLRGEGG